MELTADDAASTIVDAARERFGARTPRPFAGIFEPQPFETQPWQASIGKWPSMSVRPSS